MTIMKMYIIQVGQVPGIGAMAVREQNVPGEVKTIRRWLDETATITIVGSYCIGSDRFRGAWKLDTLTEIAIGLASGKRCSKRNRGSREERVLRSHGTRILEILG